MALLSISSRALPRCEPLPASDLNCSLSTKAAPSDLMLPPPPLAPGREIFCSISARRASASRTLPSRLPSLSPAAVRSAFTSVECSPNRWTRPAMSGASHGMRGKPGPEPPKMRAADAPTVWV